MENKNDKKITVLLSVLLFFAAVLILILCVFKPKFEGTINTGTNVENISSGNTNDEVDNVENKNENNNEIVNNNQHSDFDFKFLKLENQKKNKIYSPLSIKYALKMLEDASEGETKKQITDVLGNINLTKYKSSENLSLANSFFIRDTFKSNIKETYINMLKDKYDAEINYDTFENATNINDWIKNKTLGIIPQILSDDEVKEIDFSLVNALAIDMEWKEKFLQAGQSAIFPHEKANSIYLDIEWGEMDLSQNTFKSGDKEFEVSGMRVNATINNYDIIKELGKENIEKIVREEYTKFAKNEDYDEKHVWGDSPLSEDVSDAGIQKDLNEFMPNYITGLSENYHKVGFTTDFSIYVDDNVKVFAKDLKEYDGTTLQYVGIMPVSTELDKFIEEIDKVTVDNYISSLKGLKYEDFKEGVVTKIRGYIPKFKFNYELDLKTNLERVNVIDVFDIKKANISNMIETEASISGVKHKADIEFTQDGIKAAAATVVGGGGGGEPFDYKFDVPVEVIDITFDKPYMFLIRDKETDETWFVGTVYEPLLWADDTTSGNL